MFVRVVCVDVVESGDGEEEAVEYCSEGSEL